MVIVVTIIMAYGYYRLCCMQMILNVVNIERFRVGPKSLSLLSYIIERGGLMTLSNQ